MQSKLIEKKAFLESEMDKLKVTHQQHSQAIQSINVSLIDLNGQLKIVNEFLEEDSKA